MMMKKKGINHDMNQKSKIDLLSIMIFLMLLLCYSQFF